VNSNPTEYRVYRQDEPPLRGRQRWLVAAALVVLALILISASATVVEVGTVGVVKRLGRVTGAILDPGLHFLVPFTDSVIVYNTKDIVYEVGPADKQSESQADYLDYPVDSR